LEEMEKIECTRQKKTYCCSIRNCCRPPLHNEKGTEEEKRTTVQHNLQPRNHFRFLPAGHLQRAASSRNSHKQGRARVWIESMAKGDKKKKTIQPTIHFRFFFCFGGGAKIGWSSRSDIQLLRFKSLHNTIFFLLE